ncbi:MAG: homoserine dehydrogenase [Clostridiales bacterium]|jgi:homoserine dehydrogenase|nr:homoserine dehydrogenase [Clostridiales bacterium]
MAYAAVLGYGVVGSGVFGLLRQNAALIEKRMGEPIAVKRVLDLRSFPGDSVEPFLTHDAEDIINDAEIGVVAEAMGGLNPAYEYSMRALRAGKHVVTSNKELVSVHGAELMAAAAEYNVCYLFEASVGGAIPVIQPLKHMLLTESVSQVAGILNGTTNYILTQMREHDAGFAETLKDAQDRGYAERDPSADIDGFDACRKLAILLSVCLGKYVNYSKIPTEGIAGITSDDFAFAAVSGNTIKLIARADIKGSAVEASVAPMILSKDSRLGVVGDVYNAVSFTFDAKDNILLGGRGAGKYPTAGAIVSDMAEALRRGCETPAWTRDEAALSAPDEVISTRMIRYTFTEQQKSRATVHRVFGTEDLIWANAGILGQAAFFTRPMKEREFACRINLLKSMPDIGVKSTLRLYAGR